MCVQTGYRKERSAEEAAVLSLSRRFNHREHVNNGLTLANAFHVESP